MNKFQLFIPNTNNIRYAGIAFIADVIPQIQSEDDLLDAIRNAVELWMRHDHTGRNCFDCHYDAGDDFVIHSLAEYYEEPYLQQCLQNEGISNLQILKLGITQSFDCNTLLADLNIVANGEETTS